MKKVKPIPTPPALKWREFRIELLPVLVFLVVLGVVVWIWVHHVTPPLMVGQVEAVRADIVSTQAGLLANLEVGLLEPVHAGEPVATIITTDPKILESTLAVIRAELELLRAQLEDPLVDRERTQVTYERLRLDLLQHRVDLAQARVRLQYAESELARKSALYHSSTAIVSRAEYELAQAQRDALQAEIREREATIRSIEQDLARFRLANPSITNAQDAFRRRIQAAMDLQEKRLRLAEAQLSPITLKAPIDGVVTMLYRRSGENVVAGEPIATITATNASRIVAYLLPPWTDEIKEGSLVEVVRRSARRETGLARVVEIGQVMQPVPPTLFNPIGSRWLGLDRRPLNWNAPPIEIGIPVIISLPEGLSLRPGELVDLRYAGARPSWKHLFSHAMN